MYTSEMLSCIFRTRSDVDMHQGRHQHTVYFTITIFSLLFQIAIRVAYAVAVMGLFPLSCVIEVLCCGRLVGEVVVCVKLDYFSRFLSRTKNKQTNREECLHDKQHCTELWFLHFNNCPMYLDIMSQFIFHSWQSRKLGIEEYFHLFSTIHQSIQSQQLLPIDLWIELSFHHIIQHSYYNYNNNNISLT